ncbi:hypothetical protein BVU76_05395 [Mycolicibacterium porcinum]|nr:hypothetical protein BVU76_05395 [Mycolicibacterium porcinum]
MAAPALIPGAIEEMLRYEAPSPVQARYVAGEGGFTLAPVPPDDGAFELLLTCVLAGCAAQVQSLTYDHRIIDGADAAPFLTAIKQRLETGFTDTDLA